MADARLVSRADVIINALLAGEKESLIASGLIDRWIDDSRAVIAVENRPWKGQPYMAGPITDQPDPTPSTGDVWRMVIQDMEDRRAVGIERYGTPLQPHNGRDPLVDAYQEALDLAVYLRQAIEERMTR